MAQPRVGSTMTGSLASTSGPTQTNPLPVQVLMASSSSLVPCLQLSAPFSPLLAARATFRARQPLPHHAPRTSCYAPRTPATPLAPLPCPSHLATPLTPSALASLLPASRSGHPVQPYPCVFARVVSSKPRTSPGAPHACTPLLYWKKCD